MSLACSAQQNGRGRGRVSSGGCGVLRHRAVPFIAEWRPAVRTCPVCPPAHGVSVLKGPCRAASRARAAQVRMCLVTPAQRCSADPPGMSRPRPPPASSARSLFPRRLRGPLSPLTEVSVQLSPLLPLSPASCLSRAFGTPLHGAPVGVLVTCELRGGCVCLEHARFISVCGATTRGLRVLCHPVPGTQKCKVYNWVRGAVAGQHCNVTFRQVCPSRGPSCSSLGRATGLKKRWPG